MLKSWIFILLGISPLIGTLPADHPIHIALAEIHQNKETNRLEMSIKIFIDDLEDALALQGYNQLYIGTEKEHKAVDTIIHQYIRQYFRISQQQKSIDFDWVGKELSDDYMAIWCYLESDPLTTDHNIDVQFCLLMDLYGDQKNILHAYLNSGNNIHKIFTFRQCKRF